MIAIAGLKAEATSDAEGRRVLTICNACRYCEQFCPVFPAMERRLDFAKADLTYLANLCHNCGECLYACQFAPPHEFGINVPQTLGAIRAHSYEEYCWPRPLAEAFRRNGLRTALGLAATSAALTYGLARLVEGGPRQPGNFYAIVPHDALIAVFGTAFLFAAFAMQMALMRFWSDLNDGRSRLTLSATIRGLRDALSLRHLHSTGPDCTSREETRQPWRRWFHHCTLYGFLLCFASTSVAAIYHGVFGWIAPYEYASLPVALGTAGGLGLLIGPCGLLVQKWKRDPALTAAGRNHDEALITLLFLTSLTGLALLVLRGGPLMPPMLIAHLGLVLALFLTLPYGKFVHGLYRTAALIKDAAEGSQDRSRP
jgi:citrate/tricarballylate utilization protein